MSENHQCHSQALRFSSITVIFSQAVTQVRRRLESSYPSHITLRESKLLDLEFLFSVQPTQQLSYVTQSQQNGFAQNCILPCHRFCHYCMTFSQIRIFMLFCCLIAKTTCDFSKLLSAAVTNSAFSHAIISVLLLRNFSLSASSAP